MDGWINGSIHRWMDLSNERKIRREGIQGTSHKKRERGVGEVEMNRWIDGLTDGSIDWSMYGSMDRWINLLMDWWMIILVDWWIDQCINGWIFRWIDVSIDQFIDQWINRFIYQWIDRSMDRSIEWWIDGWMDQCIDPSMNGLIKWMKNEKRRNSRSLERKERERVGGGVGWTEEDERKGG